MKLIILLLILVAVITGCDNREFTTLEIEVERIEKMENRNFVQGFYWQIVCTDGRMIPITNADIGKLYLSQQVIVRNPHSNRQANRMFWEFIEEVDNE